MARSRDEMVASMTASGSRLTPQRLAVVQYLAGRDDHPSPRQVFDHLSGVVPSLSLATVYNTLALLVKLGQLREIEFDGSDNRYDTELEPHINLVCTRCGSIVDVDGELPFPVKEIRSRFGFTADDFRIEYRGRCARCGTQETGGRFG